MECTFWPTATIIQFTYIFIFTSSKQTAKKINKNKLELYKHVENISATLIR